MIINPEAWRMSISDAEASTSRCALAAMGTAMSKPAYGKVPVTRSRIAAAVSAGCASGSQWPALNSRNS
jgi:hypothetical protein